MAANASAQSGSAVTWQSDLDAARATAAEQNKLLLVHFYTDNCAPCRELDLKVFSQPGVGKVVHEHFVPVKLNAEEFQATAERFGVTRVPTDVVLMADGRVVERLVSPAEPMAYVTQINGIAQQYVWQSSRNYRQSDSQRSTSEPLNSAYAGLSVERDTYGDGRPGDRYAIGDAAGRAQPRYGQSSARGSATAGREPESGNRPSTAAAVDVANPYVTAPRAQAQGPNGGDRYAAAQPPAAPAGSAAPAAEPESSRGPSTEPGQAETVTLPPNSPPLGMYGYCPVTLKEEHRWQRGDTRWGAYHRGRTYLFASEERRDAFLDDGDAYAPALSGNDPVLAIEQQVAKPGKREYGFEYEGQIYLFSNQQNLQKFYAQPDRYATGVRQAMREVAGRTTR